ncbi:MAG: radical SAM protein [bacterium]|nr:radical SAM protein [bacterium]
MKKYSRKKSINLGIGNYLCNNNCIFCVDGEKEKLPLPPADRIFRLLKQWKKRTDSILFCGPEPTLNPSLSDFIRKARELGYTEIRLLTNGRMLSYYNFAKKIVSSGVTELCVSFHGSRSSIQDAQTRTPGSFQQTYQACRNLSVLRSSHSFKWFIHYTYNKFNISDLHDFLKMCLVLKGLNGVNVSAIMPKGRALHYFDVVVPRYTELAERFISVMKKNRDAVQRKREMENEFNIKITGLPFCIMKGYEDYIGPYNELFLLKDPRDKGMKSFARELEQEQIKGPNCKKCSYNSRCAGVWDEYVKRRGWDEFHPVKKQTVQKRKKR